MRLIAAHQVKKKSFVLVRCSSLIGKRQLKKISNIN